MLKRHHYLNIIFFLTFVPFSRIFFFIDSKIQPIAAIFCVLYLLFFSLRKNVVSYIVLYLFSIITLYYFIGIYKYSFGIATKTFISYLPGLLIFIVLKDNVQLLKIQIYKVFVWIYASVGLLQYFNIVPNIWPVVSHVLPVSGEPGGGYRGVAFLAPEPSNSAYIIFQLMVLNRYYYLGKYNRKMMYLYEATFLIFALMNKSGTIFLFILTYYFSLIIFKTIFLGSLQTKIKYAVIFLALFGLTVFSINTLNRKNIHFRYTDILYRAAIYTIKGDLFKPSSLIYLSGPRFLQVTTGYLTLKENFGEGFGVGSTDILFLNYFYKYFPNNLPSWGEDKARRDLEKPASYGSQIAMDCGAIGFFVLIFILCFLLYRIIKYNYFVKNDKNLFIHQLAAFLTASLMILFRTTSSMLAHWVILSVVYHYASLSFTVRYSSLMKKLFRSSGVLKSNCF